MNTSSSDMKALSGIFILVGLLALPIGMGYLAGAGVGWLTFVVICIGMAVRIAVVAKQEEKEKEDNVQSN